MRGLQCVERILLKYVSHVDIYNDTNQLYVRGNYRVDMSNEDVALIVELGFSIQYIIRKTRQGLLYYETTIFKS